MKDAKVHEHDLTLLAFGLMVEFNLDAVGRTARIAMSKLPHCGLPGAVM